MYKIGIGCLGYLFEEAPLKEAFKKSVCPQVRRLAVLKPSVFESFKSFSKLFTPIRPKSQAKQN